MTTPALIEEQRETAQQLAQRIATLQQERDSLAQQTQLARGVLADLRARLITGDATLAEVSVAQTRINALEGALSDADNALAQLRLALSEAEQRERQQAAAARLRALQDERAQLQEQFNATLRELDEACERGAARLRDVQSRFSACGKEIRELAESGDVPRLTLSFPSIVDRGCAWLDVRFRIQLANLFEAYCYQEARREEEQRRREQQAPASRAARQSG